MAGRISFHEQIRNNKLKSTILIFLIFIFFLVLGYAISLALDPGYFFIIMIIAIIFSLSYILGTYYNADKIALASVKAKPASHTEHRILFHAVENMSLASGMPMPRVFVMESEQSNAFASGRDPKNSVICVTTGALKKLNKQELEGVIAHEMGHISNYDIRFMTLTAIMVGLIAIIAQIFLRSLWFQSGRRDGRTQMIIMIIAIAAAILAPLFAQLVSFAISRKREFAADATGVKFTRYSPGLRNALIKIKDEHIHEKDKKRYSKALAPLFISDPYKKKIENLFSTHPDINKRIKILERM